MILHHHGLKKHTPRLENILIFSFLSPKRKGVAALSRVGYCVGELVCSAVHVGSKAVVLEHLGTGLGTHFLDVHALSSVLAGVPN